MVLEEKPICRMAIARLVAESGDFAPVEFAATVEGAIEILSRGRTNLVLVDLFTISYDFGGLRDLAAATSAPIIAVDDRLNPTFAGLAQGAGARGYACKSFQMEEFRAVLRSVMDGATHFPRTTQPAQHGGRRPRTASGLTPRQLEVLKCVAVGMSNQEIARALGITTGTVKLHIHTILALIGARNRTEAAMIAGRFLAATIDR